MRALDQLPEREREVVKLRFGVNGTGEPTPLRETGRRHGPLARARAPARGQGAQAAGATREMEGLRRGGVSEDPTTQELRLDQLKRERAERERGRRRRPNPDDTGQHEARAAKAGYLREKLEERAEAERRAAAEDTRTDRTSDERRARWRSTTRRPTSTSARPTSSRRRATGRGRHQGHALGLRREARRHPGTRPARRGRGRTWRRHRLCRRRAGRRARRTRKTEKDEDEDVA